MEALFSIKKRIPETGEWVLIGAETIAGKTLEQVLAGFIGQEVVAEFKIDGRRCFIAGTDHWRERMSRKGNAFLFGQAVEILKRKNPYLLAEIIPAPADWVEVFEGAKLPEISVELTESPQEFFQQ